MTASDFDRAVEVMARAAFADVVTAPRAWEAQSQGSRDQWTGDMHRALRALTPFLPEIGWKLVPVVATEGMHDAARDWSYTKYGKPIGRDASAECFAAMVSVAPNPLEGDNG